MRKSETFFDRYTWKVLLAVFLILGFFGVNGMGVGAVDLQNGKRVFLLTVANLPGFGTSVPVISGLILSAICVTMLGPSFRKFFRS